MRTRGRGKEQKGKRGKDKPCKIYIFTEGDTEEIYLKHYSNKKKEIAEIKKLVKKDAPDYKETTDIFNILADKQEIACRRALLLHKAQSEVHEKVLSHECNPYTNIFEFIEYIKGVKKDIR